MRRPPHPLRYGPAALWAGGLWFASSFDWRKVPWRDDEPSRLWLALVELLPSWLPWDKAVHALIFGVLAALLRAPSRLPRGRAEVVAVALAATWGVVDELHQSTVPGRQADPWDALADLTGALLAACALGLWLQRRPRGPGRQRAPQALGPSPTSPPAQESP